MPMTEFSNHVLPDFETFMRQTLDKSTSKEGIVEEAMLYSITNGGKRLRPLLLLATIQSFQEDYKLGLHAAAALEWIHTYSLIHDDLPAMDDDDLRRGEPTNHKVFGEATAILAGDALLTKAFEVIAEGPLPAEKKLILVKRLAEAAGHEGMVGGQLADIEGENTELSIEQLQEIHERKTGALLMFALYAGGVIADVSDTVLSMLVDLAQKIGLAYQIRDDILDVIGDAEELGKNTGMDEARGKSTYPGLLTLAGARQAFHDELGHAYAIVAEIKNQVELEGQTFDVRLLASFIDLLALDDAQ